MTVPLRIVLAVFIGVISISSAIIAFTPTYLQSLDSVDEVFTSLRVSLVSRATTGIQNYFSGPVNLVKNLEGMILSGTFNPENYTNVVLHDALCRALVTDTTNSAQNLKITFHDTLITCDRRGALSGCVTTPAGYACYGMVPGTFTANYSNRGLFLAFTPEQILNISTYKLAAALTGTQRWIDQAIAGYSLTITAAAPYTNPITGTVGTIVAEALPGTMSTFLKTRLGLSVNSRAVLLHRTSKDVVANSWGANVEFLNWSPSPPSGMPAFFNILLPDAQRTTFRTLTNMSEPLMDKVLGAIGGETGLYALAAPHNGQIGSGRDAVYFTIDDITDPSGLRMRLVVAVPAEDYTAQLYDSANVVYGAVSGATAGMIIVGAIFAFLLTSAITRIGQRMELAAEFRDNEPDDALSVFGEIAAIQVSFQTMKGHLTVMKAYLPAAVLATLLPENSDDDEEEDDDAAVDEREEDQKTRLSDAMTHVSSNASSAFVRRKDSRASSAALTKHSTGSVASKRAAGGAHGGGGVSRLSGATVSVKSVSVLCVNLRGWHTMCRTMTPSLVTQVQERYLSVVFACAREEKGVVDFFSGDRVLVTFNAVSSCPGHPRRAANAAYAIRSRLEESNASSAGGPALLVTAGISSGNALVGNVGSAEAKRFNVMGTVYSEAIRLEQVARGDPLARELSHAPILLHRKCLAECVQDYTLQFLGVASLDATGNAATRCLYAALEAKKKVDDDEWMYQLAQGKSSDPFAAANDAYIAVFGGASPGAVTDDAMQQAAKLLQECDLPTCVGGRRLQKCVEEWNASPSATQKAAAYVTISAL